MTVFDLDTRPWPRRAQLSAGAVAFETRMNSAWSIQKAQILSRNSSAEAVRCHRAGLSTMQLTREELLMKLGAARDQSRTAWRLVTIEVAAEDASFSYRLDRNKLRQTRWREGRYLLRTNLVEEDPAKLWGHYLLLMAVEEAFKNLKGDLAIRPVFHQLEARIEAHVFIAFLAYCLHVTLARRLHALAPGLTPRSVLEKFAAMQMIDVHLPTTDGRELVLTRYTEPEPELSLLLNKLKLELPAQPPPKITAGPRSGKSCSSTSTGAGCHTWCKRMGFV